MFFVVVVRVGAISMVYFCLLPLFAFMKIYHGFEPSIWRAPCTMIFAADWVSRLEGPLRLRAIDTSACTYDNT